MTGQRKRGFIRLGSDENVEPPKKWGLPDYGAELGKKAKETAMNYDPAWMPSFDDPEPELPQTLTDEEIELIKRSAYQEGIDQGKAEGYQQGFELGKQGGFEVGHQEGLQTGKTEGLEAGQQAIQEQVNVLITLADQFAQPLQLMNAQVEKQLVDMVLTLVKEVVHVEVQTNPQVILDTVKESVEALPVTGHVIHLKLHPEDYELVKNAYGEAELNSRQWTLSSEPALNRGDVQIEAGESSVSYRMEERIRSVLQRFCGTNRHQVGQE